MMLQTKNSQNAYSGYGPGGSVLNSFSHKKGTSVDSFRPLAANGAKMLKFAGDEGSSNVRRSIVGKPVIVANGQKSG